jgi:hypothetical protein
MTKKVLPPAYTHREEFAAVFVRRMKSKTRRAASRLQRQEVNCQLSAKRVNAERGQLVSRGKAAEGSGLTAFARKRDEAFS